MLLHFDVGGAQFAPHVPWEQTSPVAQALPHAPQLALSFWTAVQTVPHRISFVAQSGIVDVVDVAHAAITPRTPTATATSTVGIRLPKLMEKPPPP